MNGGTFCRFLAGRPGRGSVYLRYILRPQALGAGTPGIWTRHLPEPITRPMSVEAQVRSLLAYAWSQEACERADAGERAGRTYYSALLSFERPLPAEQIAALLERWLDESFPRQPTIAALHRNTGYRHVHVWVAARGIDGRQLNLDAARYRQLDERWNRLYAPAVGREEREHLDRKRGWEARKRAFRLAARTLRDGERDGTMARENAQEASRERSDPPQTPPAERPAPSESGPYRPVPREPSPPRRPAGAAPPYRAAFPAPSTREEQGGKDAPGRTELRERDSREAEEREFW
jgi:hypothetical protein